MSDLPNSFWEGLQFAAFDLAKGADEGEHSQQYQPLSAVTDSPIERLLALTALCHWRMMGETMTLHHRSSSLMDRGLRSADLISQAQIGSYRVDFLLLSTLLPRHVRIVVECDGHDFHERTKEQAARDRSRDRTLTGLGYTVLRYTGSEIHQDPWACAQDLYTHYDGRFYDAYVQYGRPVGDAPEGSSE